MTIPHGIQKPPWICWIRRWSSFRYHWYFSTFRHHTSYFVMTILGLTKKWRAYLSYPIDRNNANFCDWTIDIHSFDHSNDWTIWMLFIKNGRVHKLWTRPSYLLIQQHRSYWQQDNRLVNIQVLQWSSTPTMVLTMLDRYRSSSIGW